MEDRTFVNVKTGAGALTKFWLARLNLLSDSCDIETMHTVSDLFSSPAVSVNDQLDTKYIGQLINLLHTFFEPKLPDVLWHYTTVDSAEKIISGDCLLFTHVSELNDTTEVEYAANLSRRQLDKWLSEYSIGPEQKMLLIAARSSLLEKNNDSSWYTFSLSDARDDWPQWNAYGEACSGVSIGFDSRNLIRFLSNSPNSRPLILPVCYDEARVCRFGDAVIDLTLQNFLEDFAGATQNIENFMDRWGKHVDAFSLLPKKDDFRAEREWRFAIQPDVVQISIGHAMFGGRKRILAGRGKNSDFSHSQLPIVEVIEGPKVSVERRKRIENALRAKAQTETVVSKSTIPLRS